MQFTEILAALRKHKLAASLIGLQIALACAVLCNACFLISQRIASLHTDSGVDEAALGVIKLAGVEGDQAQDVAARVSEALRSVAGVQRISFVNQVPFGEHAGTAGVELDAQGKHFGGVIDFNIGDPSAIEALGLRLVAGRLPTPQEYMPIQQYLPAQPPVLITRQLAEAFWPGESPLGQRIWGMGTVSTVIGVIEHLAVAAPGGGEALGADWSVFVPALAGPNLASTMVVRGNPADMPRIMRDAIAAVQRAVPDAVVNTEQSQRISELRDRYYSSSRTVAAMLFGVIAALLTTTALGIFGLTSYWVTQRGKQIGIRRALGATRGDIQRYFLLENFIVVSVGLGAGLLLAFAMSFLLMRMYELPPLPPLYVLIAACMLWLVGALAAWAPALRAAAVSPLAAMRAA